MTTPRRLFAPLLAVLACALAGPAAEAATVKYYHLDAVGNVLAVTRADGAVLETHDYLPYGEEWCAGAICGSNRTPGQPLRFTGKERDTETGLDYFGARYYGSRIGRFTTIDPMMTIDANLLDPQRWNRYSYALNSPMRFNDPDGRSPKLITGAIKLAIKGGDIYSTVSGIVDAGSTVFSLDPNVGTGERALATGMLLLEISGASDAYAAGKAIRSAAARPSKGATEMANDLSDRIGRNSVPFETPSTSGHIDLRGKAHYDKATHQDIPTPHVQTKQKHVGPDGQVNLGKDTTTRPATKADIRTAEKLVERREQ